MDSVVLCHASGDEAFARGLAKYLEVNLPFAVSCGDSVVGPDLDLIEAAELALSAEAALVLLSPFSVPKVWNRKTWEPMFFEKPKEYQTRLAFVLVSECNFPPLFRRERFFDASVDALAAARLIKRWLLRPAEALIPASPPATPELDAIRVAVADQPGTAAEIPVELAERFATDYAADFEAVCRFDCRDRSRAGIVGDVNSALGLLASGTVEENKTTLTEWCTTHRVLFILAGVSAEDRDFATLGGRSSVIFAEPPAGDLPYGVRSAAADAVRSFQKIVSGDLEAGLRLGWMAVSLLKAQERHAEVSEALGAMHRAARDRSDRSALLRIEREQFWVDLTLGHGAGRALTHPDLSHDRQLVLPFTERETAA